MPASCSAAAQAQLAPRLVGSPSGAALVEQARARPRRRRAGLRDVDLEAALQLAHRGRRAGRAPPAARARPPGAPRGRRSRPGAARRAPACSVVDAEVRRQRVEDREAAADDRRGGRPSGPAASSASALPASRQRSISQRRPAGRDAAVADAARREHLRRPRRPCPTSRAPRASGAARTARALPRARRRRRSAPRGTPRSLKRPSAK